MTTTVISTIRSSGGDYTTLSAWEAGEQGNLVSADEIRVAECYDDWPSGLNNTVTVSGSTTDSTRYMKITVAAGHRHDGTPGSGFFITSTSTAVQVVRLSDAYAKVEWVDSFYNNTGGTDGRSFYLSSSTATADRCIGRSAYTGSDTNNYNFDGVTTGGAIRNSLAIGGYNGMRCLAISNCVVTGAVVGITRLSGEVVRNTIAYANTTNYAAGSYDAASSNNATSSATDNTPNANAGITGVTSAAFVNAASNDFHLASGSVLIGAGINLYSTFTTDIDGDTWPSSGAWDIGFDYRVSGTTTLTPGLFSNSNTFYSPTVSRGAVTLTPSLFTSATNAFYSATVTQGGATQTLTPSLFSNSQSFFSATVTPGGGSLYPSLLTNGQTFYAPTVTPGSVTLTPSLFTSSTNAFYAPTVTQEGGPQYLTVPLVSNTSAFYAPTVTPGAITITPDLFANAQTFYAATVSQGAPGQTLEPELLVSTNQFFTAIVTVGGVTLTPSLFTNSNTFYAHLLTGGDTVNAILSAPRSAGRQIQNGIRSNIQNTRR